MVIRDALWWTVVLILAMKVTKMKAFLNRPPSAKGRMPEMWMSTAQIIVRRGYHAETHVVRTPDGYLLKMHRISPRGSAHRTPVLFGHGMGSNSEQWVLRENDNLAFQIVDLGFDVWLGNFRGSFYGRNHVTLTTRMPKFWAFSFHENGVYDQTAMVDYVLMKTGRAALLTLSHSLSCTAQLVLLAERPDYAKKILGSVLLAPPSYNRHPSESQHLLESIANNYPSFRTAIETHKVRPKLLFERPVPLFCFPKAFGPPRAICSLLLDLYMGDSENPRNTTLHELHSAHWPAGVAAHQVWHYVQLGVTGDFQRYDFGVTRNIQLYGSPLPPVYNISQIRSPVYIYFGETDNLVGPKNVELLVQKLPNVKRLHKVPLEKFSHLDFLVSPAANEVVYKHVIHDLLSHVHVQ